MQQQRTPAPLRHWPVWKKNDERARERGVVGRVASSRFARVQARGAWDASQFRPVWALGIDPCPRIWNWDTHVKVQRVVGRSNRLTSGRTSRPQEPQEQEAFIHAHISMSDESQQQHLNQPQRTHSSTAPHSSSRHAVVKATVPAGRAGPPGGRGHRLPRPCPPAYVLCCGVVVALRIRVCACLCSWDVHA